MARTRPSALSRLAGRSRRPGRDDGIALVTVIATMAVVTLLLLGSLAVVVRDLRPARAAQDSTTAMAAAQAGVDEYVSRLNVSDTYWTKGNVDTGNLAFTTGRAVPGTGSSGATYTYRLLNSVTDIATNGVIQLQVTGTATAPSGETSKRTIVASLKVNSFLRYIYFTDVEASDPALWSSKVVGAWNGATTQSYGGRQYALLASPSVIAAHCSTKYWENRKTKTYKPGVPDPAFPGVDTTTTVYSVATGAAVGTLPGWNGLAAGSQTVSGYCSRDIQFTSGDVIRGPLHSNDSLLLNGAPLFANADTTVSWPSNTTLAPMQPPGSAVTWGTGTPSAGTSAQPGYVPTRQDETVNLPTGNTELLRYVRPKVDSDPNTDRKGCLYTGATRFTFGAGGTVQVYSPNTTTTAAGCFDAALRGQPQTLAAVPPVLYVAAATGSCSGVGYPLDNEVTTGTTTNYDPCRGTAYVSGTIKGQATVSAADDIVVTGNTQYSDGGSGTDVLGLIATGFVWIGHPVDGSGGALAPTVSTVQAAVLSLKHSMIVQNYDKGSPLGNLTVLGSITQKFRGPVGTGNGTTSTTGYLKDYNYDSRLGALQPPYFLKPVSSPWTVTQITDGQSR